MEFESIVIPATNDFASLYIEQKDPVKGFFHYNITENTVFKKRLEDVMERKYNRLALANCIENYMMRFPNSEQTNESLKKLRHETSTVVIGGQQAGLLTGPLYTIHKVISIIKLAEQQEEILGSPVVPVFWIAGEDHDILEINHIYTEAGETMKKISFPANPNEKKMTSDIQYNKEEMQKWVETIFMHYGEREFTKSTLDLIRSAINECETITDLFSYIIMSLFKNDGLLIIDAADPSLRKMEAPFFSQLIDQSEEITEAVFNQQELISKQGFNKVIEIDPNAANLFYYFDGERTLLEYNAKQQVFEAKNGFQLSKVEIQNLLLDHPERFSNNVVTRPLMQEWLFPSLAFIAGPGEIAYWGELKQAFELVNNMMPPIIPRMNMTIMDAAIERDLLDLNVPLEKVLTSGVEDERAQFLEAILDKELQDILNHAKSYLETQYQSLLTKVEDMDHGLVPLVHKNLDIHINQLNFLEKKAKLSLERKHHTMLEKYNRIARCLHPNAAPQERIWNVFYYLNEYGEEFIQRLMAGPYKFDGTHKIIKI